MLFQRAVFISTFVWLRSISLLAEESILCLVADYVSFIEKSFCDLPKMHFGKRGKLFFPVDCLKYKKYLLHIVDCVYCIWRTGRQDRTGRNDEGQVKGFIEVIYRLKTKN